MASATRDDAGDENVIFIREDDSSVTANYEQEDNPRSTVITV